MIKVRLDVGKKIVTKNSLFEWVLKQTKVPELAIGEITINDDDSLMEIHVEKISYVIGVLKSKKFEDNPVNPKVC